MILSVRRVHVMYAPKILVVLVPSVGTAIVFVQYSSTSDKFLVFERRVITKRGKVTRMVTAVARVVVHFVTRAFFFVSYDLC